MACATHAQPSTFYPELADCRPRLGSKLFRSLPHEVSKLDAMGVLYSSWPRLVAVTGRRSKSNSAAERTLVVVLGPQILEHGICSPILQAVYMSDMLEAVFRQTTAPTSVDGTTATRPHDHTRLPAVFATARPQNTTGVVDAVFLLWRRSRCIPCLLCATKSSATAADPGDDIRPRIPARSI